MLWSRRPQPEQTPDSAHVATEPALWALVMPHRAHAGHHAGRANTFSIFLCNTSSRCARSDAAVDIAKAGAVGHATGELAPRLLIMAAGGKLVDADTEQALALLVWAAPEIESGAWQALAGVVLMSFDRRRDVNGDGVVVNVNALLATVGAICVVVAALNE